MVTTDAPQSLHTRRADIDWLRVLAVLLLIPFHSARVFDVGDDFYVRNAALSRGLSYFMAFLNVWQLPLLFTLAGASTALALGRRTGRAYLRERIQRLGLPLLAGLLALVPPQTYLALRAHTGEVLSFPAYYPRFFRVDWSDLSGYAGTFSPAHLWFILFLLAFSVAGLPLFLWLRGQRGRRVLARLGTWSGWPGASLLFAAPLALAALLPDLGGKNPFFYFALVVIGYLLAAEGGLQGVLDRDWRPALALGVPTMAAWLATRDIGGRALDPFPGGQAVGLALGTVNTWLWTVALLGLGRRYLHRGGPALRYLSEASYPYYILHQTAIVAIAYLVVHWEAGVAVKYVAIALGSLTATAALYEGLVRRSAILRPLFGLKPRVRAGAPSGGATPEIERLATP
jgi:peptidoglycan/LPS O-acetylase OafA/YrhL